MIRSLPGVVQELADPRRPMGISPEQLIQKGHLFGGRERARLFKLFKERNFR